MAENKSREKVRVAPKIEDFPSVQRAFQDIEKVINGLIDSVNTKAEGEITTDKDGQTGDIKITQNADKTYTFEVRTDDGWKTPVMGDSAIKFKNKPAAFAKNKKESIDEIETNDILTGSIVAKKTIFDEKADKFVLPRPDYESGWFEATTTKIYVTGATTGVSPNSCSLYTAGHVVGIPALGFELNQIPMKWELLIAQSGTTGWDDIKDGGTNSWVANCTGLDNKFSAHSTWYDPSGCSVFLTSKEHFAISTGNDYIMRHILAGGNDITRSTCAMNLRIWK